MAEGSGKKGAGASEFEQEMERARGASTGPVAEFWYFLNRTRKWWMVPILLALLTAGVLLVIGGTAVAPLIYAVF